MNVRANIDMDKAGLAVQASHYADIRKRLFGKPTKIKTVAIVKIEGKAPEPEPIVLAQLPLWSVVDLYFDWHVRVWHEAIERQVADLAHENVALRAALKVQKADLDEMTYMPRRLTKHIIAEVLENFPGVTWEDLKSKHRTSNIVYPRQLCMYEIHRQRKDLSYPAIGRLFGGRDHTTVLHAVRKIESMTSDDKQAAEWMQRKHVKRTRKPKPSPYAAARLAEIHDLID
jgi:chromosomal replication initiator protein